MNVEKLKKAILDGNFLIAKEYVDDENYDSLENLLMDMAGIDSDNLSPYFFVLYLILENENAKLHEIASALLSFPYAWISGGYSVALKHLRKAMAFSPENMYYKELILFYHDIPDRLLSKEDAIKYAKQVLEVNPSVKVAQDIINRYK